MLNFKFSLMYLLKGIERSLMVVDVYANPIQQIGDEWDGRLPQAGDVAGYSSLDVEEQALLRMCSKLRKLSEDGAL